MALTLDKPSTGGFGLTAAVSLVQQQDRFMNQRTAGSASAIV
jgi:hypothetical protein